MGGSEMRGGDVSGHVAEREIYFDNNATTRALPEVIEAVAEAMSFGPTNASSLHGAGRQARNALSRARAETAVLVGADESDVIFTSGATEANNIVLLSLLGRLAGHRLVTSVVEHSSIIETAGFLERQGVSVKLLPVDENGLISEDGLAGAIVPGKTLVSIQWANNETGVIQPIERLASVARAQEAIFHTDAVQAVGKIPISLPELPVDLLSISGHKLHGPMGVGALVGPGLKHVSPLMHGGAQENNLRPGTENVPGIVGLARALQIRSARMRAIADATSQLRDRLEDSLSAAGLVSAVNGSAAPRLPNTTNLQFEAVDGEALTIRLDQEGVRCSQSSACTNRKPEPSYVLRAMGLTESEAYSSIRFGFSELNTAAEVDMAGETITLIHEALSRFAMA
jgi:cysteine desulfurase